MKLLVVMLSYPFPPRVGSAIIAYNNIKEISKKHSVYFICLDFAKEPGDFAEFVEQIEFISPKKIPKFIRRFRYVFNMLLRIPYLPTMYMLHEIQKRVRNLIEDNKLDAKLPVMESG